MNQAPYQLPSDLEAAIAAFVNYYNYRSHHKALFNVKPPEVLKRRRQKILRHSKLVQCPTTQRRRHNNRAFVELTRPLSSA